MDSIKLSVRELVGFVYKGGDLGQDGISVERAREGTRIHKLLQGQMSEGYKKEYYLKYEFVYQDIDFIVEGRADGISTEGDRVIIDEIKSTYQDLDKIDEDYNYSHMAQAMCYGYFYCKKEEIKEIVINLRYCNIDTQNIKVIEHTYSIKALEEFFYGLIDKYLEWAKLRVQHLQNRIASVNTIAFPFESYRQGQRDLLVAVYQTIKNNKKLFVQAPTGIGKTVSVLFPAIKALNHKSNSKIFYLTAKSSTKQMAEDTIAMLQNNGLKLRATIITAKEKICCNESFECNPESCPYAKGYYSKINEALLEAMKIENIFNREYIEAIAKRYEVCPFELSLELSYISDIVVCDYNYYFDPRVAFQREDFLDNVNDILLIDEAHNLEDRARNMYSCELVKESFYEVYKQIKTEKAIDKGIIKSLQEINKEFIELKKLIDKQKNMLLPEKPIELIRVLNTFIVRIDKWKNMTKDYSNEKLDELYFEASFFIRLSELYDENFCYYLSKGNSFSIKIFLINTSEILRSILAKSYSAIFFSATLTPLRYYRQILGGDAAEDKVISLNSPFDIDKFKLMMSSNISMKYTIRDNNIDSICEYIHTAIVSKKGNYIVFLPSYAYLNKVYEKYIVLYDDEITANLASITESEQISIINEFNNKTGVVLFTVVGGAFSEGVNLPLDSLIGAIVIGTGIPQICFERDIIKSFFDKMYNCGYEYAYKYPGFNKILQSVGRVIRTEQDRGIALLIDSRLLAGSYLELFPRHWREFSKINNCKQLAKELDSFWDNQNNKEDK